MKKLNLDIELKIEKKYPSQNCLFCGNDFCTSNSKKSQHKFCSKSCGYKYRRVLILKERLKKCLICGSEEKTEYHHIQQFTDGGKETVPLCHECHRTVTKYHSIMRTFGFIVYKKRHL